MIIFGESVYIGFSLKEASNVKTVLTNAGIKYKEKIINHFSKPTWWGTTRSSFGSFGLNKDFETQYEIVVKNSDAENAKYIIHNCNKH